MVEGHIVLWPTQACLGIEIHIHRVNFYDITKLADE